MLTNGITLGYKKDGAVYTVLSSLKKVPDFGAEPEMVENTRLNAKNKQYEVGVGDAGDLEYTFVYEDNKADSETRKILTLSDEQKPVDWEHTLPDGTKYQFTGIPSSRLVGGDLNTPIELVTKIAITSDIVRVDPAGA